MNFFKISFIFLSLNFLNGCVQSTALLAPGVTVATTGNIFQAGVQYGTNSIIRNETGKDALTHVKDVVEEDQKKRRFKKDFKILVKKRVVNARKKIIKTNLVALR
ncbi:hypothetical protein N9S67_00650 [Candidatus Pelagibacter sp.]|nr:hypothetical protein [Candidatus Pelagibacter sp.]